MSDNFLKLRIVDDCGLEQLPGAAGAIQVCGEIIFKHYYNNSKATAVCMTSDGWFDTGDTGVLDANGNLRIVGRSKEVIIINGNNFSSFELEMLLSHAISRILQPLIQPHSPLGARTAIVKVLWFFSIRQRTRC